LKNSEKMKKHIPDKYFFENLYKKYNKKSFVSPDPLQFLHRYPSVNDREIVGLIASCLAYGNVVQIVKSVTRVLEKLTPEPSRFLENSSPAKINRLFPDFKHRFAPGAEISSLLLGIRDVIRSHGSLQSCFLSFVRPGDETIISALTLFVDRLKQKAEGIKSHLLPSPRNKSACKRLNLYLRWMVRKDRVDPGGWDRIPPHQLVVPLDTHMHKIGKALDFTRRSQADLKTALEITNRFRKMSPKDPVRYDFALTRFGIRNELDLDQFITNLQQKDR